LKHFVIGGRAIGNLGWHFPEAATFPARCQSAQSAEMAVNCTGQ